MRIIEQTVVGKISREACEDATVINDDFIAVVDGSTSKSPARIDDTLSDGRLCMLTVCDFIRRMPHDITPRDFCTGVTAAVRDVYVSHNVDIRRLQANPTHRMAASTVVYSRHRDEIWMVGDCQCIVDGIVRDNPKPYEQRVADIRARYIRKALANGGNIEDFMTDDTGRAEAVGELIRACDEQNITFAVIDGFRIPFRHVRVIKVMHLSPEIVLASDGYPFLYPSLQESETALEQQLAEDPLCINTFVATKGLMHDRCSFDDRAYIRFSL